MTIVTVGIDLAKNVFAVHGADETGKPARVRPAVARAKLLELIANLPACLIGRQVCSGAHHWAREFAKFGHTVRLMAPKFVAPYRMSGKRGKNDAAMLLLQGGGGCCSEERSPVLGDVAVRRGVQEAGVVGGRLA